MGKSRSLSNRSREAFGRSPPAKADRRALLQPRNYCKDIFSHSELIKGQ
jgi:hypothetical protein